MALSRVSSFIDQGEPRIMATRFVQRSSSAAGSRTGSHSGIGVDSDDNQLYVNPAGTRRKVKSSAAASKTAASTLTAADSGSTFFLNLAAGFITTLPSPELGLEFEFIVGTTPTGGDGYVVVTASAANVLVGTIHSSTGGNADSEASGGDTFTFANDGAIKGDRAVFISDGTSWYVTAFTDADAGATITTAA
jgi:hypothetical protein